MQSSALVYPRRKHHDCTLIEDDLKFKAELADYIQNRLLVRRPGGNDAAPYGEWLHASALQFGNEFLRWRFRQQLFVPRMWIVEQGAVLSHNQMTEIRLRKDVEQIREFT